MTEARTAVLGAGAWGTALAVTLARRGLTVVLGVRRRDHLKALRTDEQNATYLPGVTLPEGLELTHNWAAAARGASTVVMAVPSRFARSAMVPVGSAIGPGTQVVSATKGIEEDTLMTMTRMLAEVAPKAGGFAVLSGPGFAAEVASGKPAALVAASSDPACARRVQKLFAGGSLRIYSSLDVTGVELAAATKNVIAIAAGISDGLEFGSSARAAVITRGLAETMRLVVAAGGSRDTVAGLSGLGDMVLTCTGALSRNRSVGVRLARGENPGAPGSAAGGRPVAEGVSNARAILRLAVGLGVEMPIVSAVYRTLYEGAAPHAMVEELLSRELKAEF